MSITFETPTADALQAQHDHYWSGALAALATPAVGDAEKLHPITMVLPYFAAYRAYAKHLDTCRVCGDDPYADCPEGTSLGHACAEAMAVQDTACLSN